MGKTKNSGLSVEKSDPSRNNASLKIDAVNRSSMIETLQSAGVRFTPEKVLFVTKDKSGQMVWLETGNTKSGLQHISKHIDQFVEKHGIKPNYLASHIKNIITYGIVVKSKLKRLKNGKMGYEKIYLYKNKYAALGAIGTNGYVVSIYPLSGGE